MNETKLKQVIDSSLSNIKEIIDVNTVVGAPISTAGGTVIIPVSKVKIGYTSGGVDYAAKRSDKDTNFAGGGGTGVTLDPVGFLVTHTDGSTEFLGIGGGSKPDMVENIINFVEYSPELIKRFKDIFAKDKKVEENAEEA